MLRIVLFSVAIACASALVCLDDTCMRVRCAAVTAESCAGGNIVKNGGYCGCCDACVQTLAEGDQCLSTLLLGAPQSARCADGLMCDPQTHTCKPMLVLSKKQATLTCAQRVQQMQLASSNGMPLLGQFVPKCAADGSYAAIQCEGSVCYCMAPDGSKITGYSATIGDYANMDCQCARDQYAYMQTGLIGKLFTCTNSGNYQRYQCAGSVCFCADNLGNQRVGSPVVPIGNIGALQC